MKPYPGIKQLLDDIETAIKDMSRSADDPQWGVPLATAKEPEQVHLIAYQLRQINPSLYSNISIDQTALAGSETVNNYDVVLHDETEFWGELSQVDSELSQKLSFVDMIVEFSDKVILIQFKLLRPVGGKIMRFNEDFFNPLLTFDISNFEKSELSSIPHDICKLIKIDKLLNGKECFKISIGIFYYTDKSNYGLQIDDFIYCQLRNRMDDIKALSFFLYMHAFEPPGGIDKKTIKNYIEKFETESSKYLTYSNDQLDFLLSLIYFKNIEKKVFSYNVKTLDHYRKCLDHIIQGVIFPSFGFLSHASIFQFEERESQQLNSGYIDLWNEFPLDGGSNYNFSRLLHTNFKLIFAVIP
jgi:hypothetical protein